jgi:hypothetical protein
VTRLYAALADIDINPIVRCLASWGAICESRDHVRDQLFTVHYIAYIVNGPHKDAFDVDLSY